MRKQLRKAIATILTMAMTMSVGVPAFAAENNAVEVLPMQQLVNALSDEAFVNDMTLYAIEKNNINVDECARLKAVFDNAYKEHDITYENGQIVVKESLNDKISEEDYEKIVSDMEVMNKCIELGSLMFNQTTGSFSTTDLELVINNVSTREIKPEEASISARILSLDLGNLVSENYDFILDTLNAQLTYSPQTAFVGTVSVWVGLVRPNGDWDYKVTYGPYDTPYTCTYGLNDSKTRLKTAEFIGNYNYGYTGNVLFSLETLLWGSEQVAGSYENDYLDHPAIEEGFEDANLIE